MGRDRAAYMREYRAAKKAAHERYDESKPLIGYLKTKAHEQSVTIAELEAEVAHLKHLLHQKSTLGTYSTRPFTPVPKTGER